MTGWNVIFFQNPGTARPGTRGGQVAAGSGIHFFFLQLTQKLL
jgi:hypothetical protein